jgi:ABC-type transport system substrate-binding protein
MVKTPRFLSSIAALLLLAPLLAACGGSAGGVPTAPAAGLQATVAPTTAAGEVPTAPQAQPGGSPAADVTVTLPFPVQDGIKSFDHAYWTSQLFVSQGVIFEGLYGYDPDLKVVPKVAESATPSADNKVWTIKLRKDKKWSNGDPVTANDFYASWIRFMGPELKDAPMWVGFMGSVENGFAFKAGATKAEDVGIKVVDDYTIQIKLTQPNAAFINLLPVTNAMPINAKSLKEHPDDWWDPKNAVYNGPYVVQSWTSGGDITLTRNPKYVGEGNGNVGTIVLRPYADSNARIQAFVNGEIQFSFLDDASLVQFAQNNAQLKDNIKTAENPLEWRGFEFDRALDAGPLSDQRVRQAFAMAIDKKAITDQVLRGLAVPTDVFNSDPRIKDNVKGLPFDVAKAKQLLADAGYPGGQGFPELILLAPPTNDPQMPMIEAAQKMWQDNLGVKVTIQNNEGPVYSTLQWASYNKDIKPGYATLGGPMNWFQPEDLTLVTTHIWYYMDFKPGGMTKYADYQDQIEAVKSLTAPGDWAALEKRANDAWAKRQQIVAQEQNEWGQLMMQAPTFEDQWDAIDKRFQAATDDKEKLSSYQDGLTLVLKEEQDTTWYDYRTEANKQALRLIIKLRLQTLDQAWNTVAPLTQLAVDSGWMIPIYYNKLYYTTDPHLSGIVVNKLAWGGIFQYQYLQWKE